MDKFNDYITRPFKGRISRRHFLIADACILITLISFIPIMIIFSDLLNQIGISSMPAVYTYFVVFFLAVIAVKILSTRRSHDYDDNIDSILYPFLPVFFRVFFKKGNTEANRFGKVPTGTFIEEVIYYKSAPDKIDPITHVEVK